MSLLKKITKGLTVASITSVLTVTSVNAAFANEGDIATTQTSSTVIVAEADNSEVKKREEIVSYAKQFLGTPYLWGGTNLTKGVDCSGFILSVMQNFGISLNRVSRDQVKNGIKISKSELEAGDLVFFDTTGKNDGGISHVGIYIGNDQFIHSSSSRKVRGVTISSLSEGYYTRTYVAATRVL